MKGHHYNADGKNSKGVNNNNEDMVKKGKPHEINLISSNGNTKDNAIRANYIKAKIAKMQQNIKWGLRGDRDKTVNQIVRECS